MLPTQGKTDERRLLVVSYIFPPFFSAGGSIRVIKFLKYLPRLGWHPIVLTVDDRQEYEHLRREGSEELLQELPPEVAIRRTQAGEPPAGVVARGRAAREQSRAAGLVVNTLRALKRWAEHWLLVPDENITWLPFAVRAGREIIRKDRVQAIFATCPPHSAAVAGMLLKWLTGRPLVLDFRDDWVDTPWCRTRPALVQAVNRLLERWTVRTAARVILVTPRSRDAFRQRYPHAPEARFVYIPNGVDLADYPAAAPIEARSPEGAFTIVHAGLLTVADDWHRSPEPVFDALRLIRQNEPELGRKIRLVFTGSLPDAYRDRVKEMGLQDAVEEVGYLPRPEFVRLLQCADTLLAINYEKFSTLVPGKIYEYWAIGGPPILLLSHPGAAQDLVEKFDLGATLDPADARGIARTLLGLFESRQRGEPVRIRRDGINEFDRPVLAGQLARTLEEATTTGRQRTDSETSQVMPQPVHHGRGGVMPPADRG